MNKGIYHIFQLLTVIALNFLVIIQCLAMDKSIFNLERANAKFEKISSNLSKQKQTTPHLTAAIEKIRKLQQEANDCIHESKAKTEELNKFLETTQNELGASTNGSSWSSIEKEKNQYANRAADCKLFVFRAQEALRKYNELLSEATAEKTLSQITHIGYLFKASTLNSITFNKDNLWKNSGIDALTQNVLMSILFFVLLGFAAKFVIRNKIRKIKHELDKQHFYTSFLLKSLKKFLTPIIVLGVISSCLTVLFYDQKQVPLILDLSYIFSVSCLLMFIGYILTFRPLVDKTLNEKIYYKKVFFNRLTLNIIFFSIGLTIAAIFKTQELSQELREAFLSLFIILMTLTTVWTIWSARYFDSYLSLPKYAQIAIKYTIIIAASFIIVIESLGYHIFGMYLVRGFSLTLLVLGLLVETIRILEYCFDFVENPKYAFSKSIRQSLGLNFKNEFPEIIIFRFICYIALFGLAFKFWMIAWMVPQGTINSFCDSFRQGFDLSGVRIYPFRIMIGAFGFCLSFITFRWIATYVANHYKRWQDKDNKVALATIITYLGFMISILIFLLLSGVNFTGLAIVAGALSVGIGFGLQHIANNFVSGVILLIQSPVRAGDRVKINGVEGFVKRIRILSTQITTIRREDVIIPNSDLLTQPVTNFMYGDSQCRINCQVGVAYGSNVELVIKLLEDVANSHEDVISDYIDKPIVFFDSFGDHALIFDLWAVIKDVNRRFVVKSDLHIAIEKVFRENNIEIAYPQLDIHFK